MRIWFLFLFVSVTTISFAQSKIDIQHYRFYITLNDENDIIQGKAEITVKFLGPGNSFELDLNQRRGNAKGMQVVSATGKNMASYDISPNRDKVNLNLQKTVNKGDTLTVSLEYSGIPADGLIISKNKYGQRTFFADN